MSNTNNLLFEEFWKNYLAITPQADLIHKALTDRGEHIENDHIALRTFNAAGVDLKSISEYFKNKGYQYGNSYSFPIKKLKACHLEHPDDLPKVFISELVLEDCSVKLQESINALLSQIPREHLHFNTLFQQRRPWQLPFSQYESLRKESEYAAWLAAFGFCANHFTINFNALTTFDSLETLNSFIKELGISLNETGGLIKGSKSVFLEQSSTLASHTEVSFSDGTHLIPSCYYEFARRYPDESGALYQGFIEKSADSIFESTSVK